MVSLETFLFGLLIISTVTGLATEAIKKLLMEHSIKYHANTLAGIVSLIISTAIGSGYILITNLEFTIQIIVCLIALIFMSWLCAMVGYDKVIQTIGQFKTNSKE